MNCVCDDAPLPIFPHPEKPMNHKLLLSMYCFCIFVSLLALLPVPGFVFLVP